MDRRIFLAGCCGMTTATLLRAAEPDSAENQWGDLKGRFVYDGEPPEPVRLEITKDVAFVKEPLFDESLLVDKENRGLANVVVTLLPGKADTLRIHPSYPLTDVPPVETTYRGFRIGPRVTILRTGQEYLQVNADPVGHNPIINFFNNQPPSSVIPTRERLSLSAGYKAAEATPASISCAIHPWEVAALVVTDHPYVGVSQADGSFVIKNLPVGKWSFRLWHERCQGFKQATIGGKERRLERGKLAVEINEGMNDLGEIKIEPKLLERKR